MLFNFKKLNCSSKITKLLPVSKRATAKEKFEIAFSVPSLVGNFYDEAENCVMAYFTSEDGTKLQIPAFYYEEFDFNEHGALIGRSNADGEWRVRVALPKEGKWSLKLTVAESGRIIAEALCEFICEPAVDTRGVIGIEPIHGRNFAFQNGELYIPIGHNLCWHSPVEDKANQATYINRIVDKGSIYGLNYIRLWLIYWSLSIKTQNCAPNDFSGGQSNAAQLDRIIEHLAEKDVYTSLVFFTHADFSLTSDTHWYECPYNKENPHGYLENPVDFWRDERARRDAKSYMRYLVSRYGYSKNIMTFELFNEADGVEGRDLDATDEWHNIMSEYVRSIDPFNHLISTSTAYSNGRTARLPSMDFTFIHCYNYPSLDWALSFYRDDRRKQKRPSIFGEIGYMNLNPHIDKNLIAPHMSNWGCMMGGTGATGMTWYWEQFDAADGYHLYKPISDFASKIPWTDPTFREIDSDVKTTDEQVKVLGYLTDNSAYLWLYDDKLLPDKANYTEFKNIKLSLPFSNTDVLVEWISTRDGVSIKKEKISIYNKELLFNIPDFKGDIAVRITKGE